MSNNPVQISILSHDMSWHTCNDSHAGSVAGDKLPHQQYAWEHLSTREKHSNSILSMGSELFPV